MLIVINKKSPVVINCKADLPNNLVVNSGMTYLIYEKRLIKVESQN